MQHKAVDQELYVKELQNLFFLTNLQIIRFFSVFFFFCMCNNMHFHCRWTSVLEIKAMQKNSCFSSCFGGENNKYWQNLKCMQIHFLLKQNYI